MKRRIDKPFVTAVLGLCVLGCGPRPTIYADRPPVRHAGDDRPIPRPAQRVFISELYDADIYVRRELVNGMDPRRVPEAADVNVLDDVPPSSWFHRGRQLADYAPKGPPRAPWTLELGRSPSSGRDDGQVIVDARGVPYELISDPLDHEGMVTGALAIGSRLLHALGYRTPEVHVIRNHEGRRVAAMQWPVGTDLGPTPIVRNREDDPNDRLPHVDRRTLRTLRMVAAWLQIGQLRPRMLRDAYVGEDGQGHVRHYVVGLDGALGVDHFREAEAFARDPDREDSNFFFRLFSLGLSPKPPAILPAPEFSSVGLLADHVDPKHYPLGPPFEPVDRVLPTDEYWIAKRLADVTPRTVDEALAAGKMKGEVTRWLKQRIERRRAEVIAYGFDRTTPCELATGGEGSVRPSPDGGVVVTLRDLSILSGFVPPDQRDYRWRVIDAEGGVVVPWTVSNAVGPTTSFGLPPSVRRPYVVLEVQARRQKKALPRGVRVHVRFPDGGRPRLAAVRH